VAGISRVRRAKAQGRWKSGLRRLSAKGKGWGRDELRYYALPIAIHLLPNERNIYQLAVVVRMTRHERRAESRQMAQEGLDWFATLFWAAILTALLLGAVFGHARVSVAYGQGMPILYEAEMFMPQVSK